MFESVKTYYQHGGATLLLLIMMSVIALGVGIERLVLTLLSRKRMAKASEKVLQHLAEGNRTMAQAVNSTFPDHPVAALFAILLHGGDAPKLGQVKRAQQRIVRAARARMWILGTIAATAPFVGLFGTVVGIMNAFKEIGLQGAGGFQVVSGGISEALITTAAGILVGVEAMALFNYLQAQIGNFSAELKETCEEIVESLTEGSGGLSKSTSV